MLTHSLGFPRIGPDRELKKSCESYWKGHSTREDLQKTAEWVRSYSRSVHQEAGVDLIPCNDFSYYDQVLDMCLMTGAVPDRFRPLVERQDIDELDLYFAMARGYQKDGLDLIPMEMTKWFDTNYHYIVPEFKKDQAFRQFSNKVVEEYREASEKVEGAKPVLIGPVSFLLLGKEKEQGFDRIDLLEALLPVYKDLLRRLASEGAQWVQMDEPFLSMDLRQKDLAALKHAYQELTQVTGDARILLATYFNGVRDNADILMGLPVEAIHLDLVRAPGQLEALLPRIPEKKVLSLGIVDGRNIWKNDLMNSLQAIGKAVDRLGKDRVMIGTSCSLLHTPYDLNLETNEETLPAQVKSWMAFAVQKLQELGSLERAIMKGTEDGKDFRANMDALQDRERSGLAHDPRVRERIVGITPAMMERDAPFPERKARQKEVAPLPMFPTTTIGSLPQTKEVRSRRSKFRKGSISQAEYEEGLRKEIEAAVRWQESIGIDVLVHGEFERNDMVEYFGEKLDGFAFTQYGWVQSYGTRCVKPPVIYGDVSRSGPMTLKWSEYAQSLTDKSVKGMLTGPVTIYQWSFPRNDQPWYETVRQIALAVRDEVSDLEQAGLRDIQVDEPALREGLPLRKADQEAYLDEAVKGFRLSSCVVSNTTRIHTHMCYSEFNDIIERITALDADVITIECARSQMELLEAFEEFEYPNDIGPGVYDIHSPRIPKAEDIQELLQKATKVLDKDRIWVNPDCGLKTRNWKEVEQALLEMVRGAEMMRKTVREPVPDA